MTSTTYLELEDLVRLCAQLGRLKIRDLGLLDSAVHRPATRLFGRDVYEGLDAKAAVMLESLVRDHALVDGNKRLGWLSTVVFLGLNGVQLDAPDDEAYAQIIRVAAGEEGWEASARRIARWHS